MKAYEAEQFQTAKTLMQQHLADYPRDTEIQLYLGIILLGEGQAEPAIQNLKAALAKLPKSRLYERPVKWYLALAYLQNGQEKEANELLLELKEGKDRYATGASSILNK